MKTDRDWLEHGPADIDAKLKLCPCCQGQAHIVPTWSTYFYKEAPPLQCTIIDLVVMCSDCCLKLEGKATPENVDAVAHHLAGKWNRRA
jgi:hypothetical protein